MIELVPKELFFTKGAGKHREKLTSFELALRSAGIAACNLVRVSSIFPPGCKILSKTAGIRKLKPGQVQAHRPSKRTVYILPFDPSTSQVCVSTVSISGGA